MQLIIVLVNVLFTLIIFNLDHFVSWAGANMDRWSAFIASMSPVTGEKPVAVSIALSDTTHTLQTLALSPKTSLMITTEKWLSGLTLKSSLEFCSKLCITIS